MKKIIIAALLHVRPDILLTGNEDLIEDGMLDSLDIINLVSELDSQFGISIKGIDITPENFRSVDTLVDLVGRCPVVVDKTI